MSHRAVACHIAALVATVSESDLWLAHALRDPDAPANRFRKYARWGHQIGQVAAVRAGLAARMQAQTPFATQLTARALAVYDGEIARLETVSTDTMQRSIE